jgi:hypothetical protein
MKYCKTIKRVLRYEVNKGLHAHVSETRSVEKSLDILISIMQIVKIE